MNILVISDLHLDTGDKYGTFQWNSEELIDQIERVREDYDIDKVILNGDIFELYKYSISEITEKQEKLIKYLNQKNFIYIKGNHDIINKDGLDNYVIKNSSNQTILIEHGHNADFLNGTKFGRYISKLTLSWFRKLTNIDIILKLYFKIIEFDDEINRIPKKYNSYKYLKYALKKLKEHDVVILGHTHKIETHHTYYLNKKKRYLNCGSCSMGRFQGIVLDTESLRYDLIKIDKNSIIKERNAAFLPLNLLYTA